MRPECDVLCSEPDRIGSYPGFVIIIQRDFDDLGIGSVDGNLDLKIRILTIRLYPFFEKVWTAEFEQELSMGCTSQTIFVKIGRCVRP